MGTNAGRLGKLGEPEYGHCTYGRSDERIAECKIGVIDSVEPYVSVTRE